MLDIITMDNIKTNDNMSGFCGHDMEDTASQQKQRRDTLAYPYLIQIIRVVKLPLTAIAVVWRMLFLPVLFEVILVRKYARAVVAREPMQALLVQEAILRAAASGPAFVAEVAFDFVGVLGGIVEVVTDAVSVEGAAAAGRHGGQAVVLSDREV